MLAEANRNSLIPAEPFADLDGFGDGVFWIDLLEFWCQLGAKTL